MLLLVWGIWRVGHGALHFEPVKRFDDVLLPIYALIVFISSVSQKLPDLTELTITIIAGVVLGALQTIGATLKATDDFDRHQRPIVKLQRGWAYIIGWFAIFLVGFGLEIIFNGEGLDGFIPALATEVKEDLLRFTKITDASAWTIYALSGISGLVYVNLLRLRFPVLRAALAHHH